MRRAIVAGTATVSGVVLLLGLKAHGSTAAAGAPQNFSIGSGPDTTTSSAPPAAAGPAVPSATPSTKATTKQSQTTGTKVVTGDAVDTRFGPVQLQVTFTGSKITKISVLQYPNETGRDQEINSYALPILNQEAIAAQSASIDAVSGATYTSDGYAQSLQSAIDKAGS